MMKRILTLDGWQSAITGLGDALRDKAKSFMFQSRGTTKDPRLIMEAMHLQNAMFARCIEEIPQDCFASGFKVNSELGDGTEIVERMRDTGAIVSLRTAWNDARVYGGGASWVIVDDGRTQDQPMNEDNVRRILQYKNFNAHEIYPYTFYEDPMDPKFGKPELFQLPTVDHLEQPRVIHESRLICFRGLGPYYQFKYSQSPQWWGESIYPRIEEGLRQWEQAYAAIGHLLNDAYQAVFKVKNLAAMISQDKDGLLDRRMQYIDMSRSIARAILLDADGEAFERTAQAFNGISDVLDKVDQKLASDVGIPITKLFGRSPAGMNATGESDALNYEKKCAGYQDEYLRAPLERGIHLTISDQSFELESRPDKWKLVYNPLREMTAKEDMEIKKMQAEIDVQYIGAQVLTPEEVAVNRFRSTGWSGDTVIDLEERQKMIEASGEDGEGEEADEGEEEGSNEEEDPSSDGEPAAEAQSDDEEEPAEV